MTGHTYRHIEQQFGDFDQWISSSMQHHSGRALPLVTIEVSRGEALPEPDHFIDNYSAVIISGSAAMVTDREAWVVRTEAWLKSLLAIPNPPPIVGICFGHQLLASALGGDVNYHPKGREIGTVQITTQSEASQDPLFHNLPQQFFVHLTHLQSVTSLPSNTVRLASSDFESTQAFRVGDNCWGLQFHPEFSPGIMLAYIDELTPALISEHFDIDKLKSSVQETPASLQLMDNLLNLIELRSAQRSS